MVLIRNIEAPRTFNGTLCTVARLHANVLELLVGAGPSRGETLFLPRLPLEVDGGDSGLGYGFRRLQFPLKCAFCLTINRCQGQTKDKIGVYLPSPVFTHGQLNVALSLVGS